MADDDITEPVTLLDDKAAWDFLAERTFGRLALTVLGQPEIFPINYVAKDAKILFRTAEGTKLMGVVLDSHVAFEADAVDADHAISVVVKGVARKVDSADELEALEADSLHPWVPTLKYNFVVIDVREISGRHFRFGPEPDRYPVM